ncbi:MAG: FtsX-like permease family protein [Campylobacterota bacterium]|nr:FtsX-like permease family protein [Campylobacterota bacterium]
MLNNSFLNFVLISIIKDKAKHFSIFIISIIIVFLVNSVFFISNSILSDIRKTIDTQADFIVQKVRKGLGVDTPLDWVDEFSSIAGVSLVTPRVYGKYYYEPTEHYFTIVGVDFFDEQIQKNIKQLVSDIDINKFVSSNNMLIGEGVKKHLDKYHYFDYYNFRPANRDIIKIDIYKELPTSVNLIANDMIIMPIELARKVLDIDEDDATDIAIKIPNDLELNTIEIKIILKHSDVFITSKEDVEKAYENMYNYKGGVFLVLYLVVIFAFIIVLYGRYSTVYSVEKKQIGILRAVGWSIKDILVLKLLEILILAIIAFSIGFIVAYFYVFYLDAPLLSNIFLGFNNLENVVSFTPIIDVGLTISLFLFYIIPFIASVLIPVWKISIIDPNESMR